MAADIGGKNCVGCGVEYLGDDERAACTECGRIVGFCRQCADDGIWPTCTDCFDVAHDERKEPAC